MLKRLFVCLLTVAAISLFSRDAAADVFDFSCISNNSATNCGVVESQLLVTITQNGSMVDFVFENTGPAASSITDIYFDDPPPLLGGMPVIVGSSSGVNFSAGCSPGSLPGGNTYGFTTAYCADSNSPTQPNGVNPTESLRLSYTLQSGYTFLDVMNAIADNSFQVGIRVQGFANGGSEAAIMNTASVPEPSTIMLFGIGAAATLVRRRRKVA